MRFSMLGWVLKASIILSWKPSLMVLDRRVRRDLAGVETQSLALPPLTD
jgi:hypothetical protein